MTSGPDETMGGEPEPRDDALFSSIQSLLNEARETALRDRGQDPESPPQYPNTVLGDYGDQQLWDSVMNAEESESKRVVEAMRRRYDTAHRLMQDVFASLYKAMPQMRMRGEVNDAHQLNYELVEQMMGTEEWRDMRRLTALDAMNAAYATRNITARLLDSLDAQTEQAEKKVAREQVRRDAIATDLGDVAAQGEEALARGDLREASACASQASEITSELATQDERLAAASAALAAMLEDAGENARMALRDAAREATREMADQKAAADALLGGADGGMGGSGWSPSGAPGAGLAMILADKIKMARQIQRSPKLLGLARRAGRYRILAHAAQRKKTPHSKEEVRGTTSGRDLSLLLTSERTRLATPELAPGFYADYASGKLALARYSGKEKLGEGPVIVCIDDSGSMHGLPEQCAKAAALAIVSVCRAKKRDVAITLFSTEIVADEYFARGGSQADWQRLATIIETFSGGGTLYEPWIGRALQHLDTAKFDKADVIVVTDGLCACLPGTIAAWQEKKRERDFSCIGVLIAHAYPGMGTGDLGLLCDRIHVLEPSAEWPDDALEDLFTQA